MGNGRRQKQKTPRHARGSLEKTSPMRSRHPGGRARAGTATMTVAVLSGLELKFVSMRNKIPDWKRVAQVLFRLIAYAVYR